MVRCVFHGVLRRQMADVQLEDKKQEDSNRYKQTTSRVKTMTCRISGRGGFPRTPGCPAPRFPMDANRRSWSRSRGEYRITQQVVSMAPFISGIFAPELPLLQFQPNNWLG